MPIKAFILTLVAAVAHSTWNLLAKRASGNRHFVWIASATEAILLSPLGIWSLAISWSRVNPKVAAFLLGTGVLHLLYAQSLLCGYRVGELSVVYCLARGTGPLLSFLGAVLFLREHPSPLAVLGACLVSLGIIVLAGHVGNEKGWAGPCWGIITGLMIAGYTLVDGYSIRVLLLSPILVEYAGNFFRVLILSVGAWKERDAVVMEYRGCWKEALAVALLTPAGYVLVLFAMRFAPITQVAPAREMSMMIGAYFGAKYLGEGDLVRRMSGALLIAAGVAFVTASHVG